MQPEFSSKTTAQTISPDQAQSLAGLFKLRVERSPEALAYRHYDKINKNWCDTTWRQMAAHVAAYQQVMTRTLQLHSGDRVAVMCGNRREWVMFEQAALGLGLVVVPVFVNDRADNVAYILRDAGVKVLLIEGRHQWKQFEPLMGELADVRFCSVEPVADAAVAQMDFLIDELALKDDQTLIVNNTEPGALASIVYTSGTTGKPKGVMLSHHNILANAYAGLETVTIRDDDLFLSFLPLSHMLERTAGYYLPMMAGSAVAYTRSIPLLGEDMMQVRPTVLISVPRIYERIYSVLNEKIGTEGIGRKLFDLTISVGWRRFERGQGRAGINAGQLLWPLLNKIVARKVRDRFGGRLRVAITGGAPMSTEVARTFLGLGINVLQGYGLTETSPVLACNRSEANLPSSVGLALPGIELKIGDNSELLARGHCVMMGYWNNTDATAATIDSEGWLHTGDQARIDDGFVSITGRLKEIIVLANGEKVPPADMEMAICNDPFFEQALVLGEGRPCLAALVVLSGEAQASSTKNISAKIDALVRHFPGYAKIRHVHVVDEPWTVENGMLTPTLKLKRSVILERYSEQIDALYNKGRKA